MRSLPLKWFPRSVVSAQRWGWVPTRMGSYLRMRAWCVRACARVRLCACVACACVLVWASACTCGCPSACMGACLRICLQACVHGYECASVRGCVLGPLRAWAGAWVRACVHGCLCVWVPTCLHICVFIHISVLDCSLPGILQPGIAISFSRASAWQGAPEVNSHIIYNSGFPQPLAVNPANVSVLPACSCVAHDGMLFQDLAWDRQGLPSGKPWCLHLCRWLRALSLVVKLGKWGLAGLWDAAE